MADACAGVLTLRADAERALALLSPAYRRLGLDPEAAGWERAAVWLEWEKQSRGRGLVEGERAALRCVVRAEWDARMDGAETIVHVAMSREEQLAVLRTWRLGWAHAEAERSLRGQAAVPLREQRAPGMQDFGKRLVHAACVRRPRDVWKLGDPEFLEERRACVAMIRDNCTALLCGDLSHRVVLEVFLGWPERLALLLLRELSGPQLRSKPYIYERVAVALLRSAHPARAELGPLLALRRGLDRCAPWERRLLGHLVAFGAPGAERVLQLWLDLPAADLLRLAARDLCALKTVLCTHGTTASPLLVAMQSALAARLGRVEGAKERALLGLEGDRCSRLRRKVGGLICALQQGTLDTQPAARGHLGEQILELPRPKEAEATATPASGTPELSETASRATDDSPCATPRTECPQAQGMLPPCRQVVWVMVPWHLGQAVPGQMFWM